MDEMFLEKLTGVLTQLDERLTAIEHSVNDVIIASLKQASDEYEYDSGLEDFKGRFPNIEEVSPKLKALYGEDFDPYKELYDSSKTHESDEGYDEESFIANTLEDIKKRLDSLVNITAEAVTDDKVEEEVKETPEGPVEEEKIETELPSEEELAKELAMA